MQLVGGRRLRPGLLAYALDRLGVEAADVGGGFRVQRAAHRHRPGAALLQGRVVEEGVGTGIEDLRRERGGLGEVAGHDPDLPAREPRQQGFEPLDVHRLGQRVGDGLLHQRMVGDLARAGEVLGAGDLVGEHRGDEILGLHALDLRRNLAPAPEARDRQRDVRVPAPAHVEHRRVEQRLGQDVAHRLRREVSGDLVEREAVALAEREHDRVLGGRRLELEVELPAEPLAQREAPGPVEPAAEARVDDELHPAALVEEALQHHRVAVRQRAQRGVPGAEVVHDLRARLGPDPGARGELAREAGTGLRRGGSGPGRPGGIGPRIGCSGLGSGRPGGIGPGIGCPGSGSDRPTSDSDSDSGPDRPDRPDPGTGSPGLGPGRPVPDSDRLGFDPSRPAPGRIEAAPQPSEQIAYALGQLGRASRRLAEPEGDVRRQALRVLHPDRAPLDAQDAPRGVAELEDVAGQALDREVLVE